MSQKRIVESGFEKGYLRTMKKEDGAKVRLDVFVHTRG